MVQRWQAAAEPSAAIIDELKDAAVVRHLVAHGLCAVEAQPGQEGQAHVFCRDPYGELVPLTLRRLNEVAQNLDKLRLQIEAASRAKAGGHAPAADWGAPTGRKPF